MRLIVDKHQGDLEQFFQHEIFYLTSKNMNTCEITNTCESIDKCKANKCIRNKNLVYPKNVRLSVWNDFERCNKKV